MIIKQNSIGMSLSVGLVEFAASYVPTGTLTLYVSKNGGGFNPAAGSATYSAIAFLSGALIAVSLQAGDDSALGELRWAVEDSASLTWYVSLESHQVVAFDPNDAAGLGLSELATAAAAATPADVSASTAAIIAHGDAHWGGGGDPLLNPVPGSYAPGEAGYAIGNMASATAASVLSTPNSIDTGLTLAQAVKLVTAVLCGQSTVAGFVVTYYDTTDSIQRIVATLDGTGQRTAVVYNTT